MEVTGGGHVSLQQFITDNPGAEGLARALQSQGLSDEQVVSMLQKSKETWTGGVGTHLNLPPPGDKFDGGLALNAFNGYSAEDLHMDIFQFMAVFQKIAQEMRQSARMDREASLQAEVKTLQDAAEKMREAAAERFKAAMVQGIAQIGAGAIQIGSAGYSMKTMATAQNSGLGPGKQGPMVSPEMQKSMIDQAANKAGNVTSAGQGAGGVIQGVGTMIAAGFERKAGELDADKAKLEAQAKIQDAAKDKANEMMQQMQDIIRDIREKLAAIQQSAIETNRGIARNI